MAKDAVATMGTILTDDVGGRDAVHVAVVSVTAGEPMRPGEHVMLEDAKADPLVAIFADVGEETIGIVDPFLERKVKKGQRFWLYLYPRTITSLRHNWTHPAFEDLKGVYVPPAQQLSVFHTSEKWLRDFCARSDCPSYETVLAAVKDEPLGDDDDDRISALFYSDYLLFRNVNAHEDIPPEFWHHMEVVTGMDLSHRKGVTHFSCSC